jgi:phage host-nuclease inhibitor protein Gam
LAGKFLTTAAVIGGFGEALKFSIGQASEAESVNAKLAAVLQSTGGAAGMSAEELDNMATSLSQLSTYDDEAIKSSEALLLTFTNIGENVFPDATKAILDMSTALGQDLQSSTIQLGKALNDPIAGITALSRVGVSFTQDQKALIKTLVDTGDTLGAQKIILAELNKEFGGQALAASKTYAGQMSQLKNEIGNLGEAVGNDLLPELRNLTEDVKDTTKWITENYEWIKKWGNIAIWVLNPFLKLSDVLNDKIRGNEEDTETTKEATQATEDYGQAALIAASAAEQEAAAIKAISDANTEMLGLVGTMQSEEEKFVQQQRDNMDERFALEAEKRELLAKGYSEESAEIQDINAKLSENTDEAIRNADEHDLANRKIMIGLLERKLMQDGVLTDDEMNWLLEKGVAWGVYEEESVAAAKAAMDEANALADRIKAVPSAKTITFTIETIGAPPNLDATNYSAPVGTHRQSHAAGGSFLIPSSYGNEGFMMGSGDTASGGERVTITPKGEQNASPAFDYDRLIRGFTTALMRAGSQ